MATLVAIFGGLMTLLGAMGVVKPATLMHGVTSLWRSGRGIHVAVGVRLIMGVVLIAAAPSCRFPEAVRILGIIALVAAVLIPIFGSKRLGAIIDWWASSPPGWVRVSGLAAAAFGAFLIYAAV